MKITEKQCTACGVVKPADAFSPDKRRSDWLQGKCKACRVEEMKRIREANPERAREISRLSFAKNRKKGTAYRIEWKRRNRDRVRGYTLKARYGITIEQLAEMKTAQDHKCAICRKDLTARAHTDHNHASGKIRGVICGGCNIAIGFIEKPGFLEAALAYLHHHDGFQIGPRSGL